MAGHDQVALLFSEGVFFADPGSPWMRGTNENGLVRQYLRKGTNLSVYDADDLAAFEAKLNGRPRKRLAWRTPRRSSPGHAERVTVATVARSTLEPKRRQGGPHSAVVDTTARLRLNRGVSLPW